MPTSRAASRAAGRLRAATQDLPGERTLANSAATLRFARRARRARRLGAPGIMVYGSSPDFPRTTSRTGTCSRR
jgi:alanine racemase